jgi:hypothetical protein
VKAFYATGGLSNASAAGCVLITDVKIVKDTEEVTAYPNPTTGKVFIKNETGKNREVVVFSLDGKQLLRTNENSVDLSAFANGVYLLNVDGKVIKVTKK